MKPDREIEELKSARMPLESMEEQSRLGLLAELSEEGNSSAAGGDDNAPAPALAEPRVAFTRDALQFRDRADRSSTSSAAL